MAAERHQRRLLRLPQAVVEVEAKKAEDNYETQRINLVYCRTFGCSCGNWLCPSLAGIELPNDGGFLTLEVEGRADTPAKIQVHALPRQ